MNQTLNSFSIQIRGKNELLVFDITPKKGVNQTEYYYDMYIQYENERKWLACGFFESLETFNKVLKEYHRLISI